MTRAMVDRLAVQKSKHEIKCAYKQLHTNLSSKLLDNKRDKEQSADTEVKQIKVNKADANLVSLETSHVKRRLFTQPSTVPVAKKVVFVKQPQFPTLNKCKVP